MSRRALLAAPLAVLLLAAPRCAGAAEPAKTLPKPDGAYDVFGPAPERVYALALEALREAESDDRDDALARLREIARIVAREGRDATRDGARVLTDALADVDRASDRLRRGIKVPPEALRALVADVQEALAFHFDRRAEFLDRRGLDPEAAYARRMARLAADHAARFRARRAARVDRQASEAGERLLENTGRGLANVFKGVSDTVEKLGRGARDSVRPERAKPADDPWR